MVILVTGGAGYIGSQVIKELSREGFSCIAYDNLSQGCRDVEKWARLVVADLADEEALDRTFAEYKPQAVMHFAAYISAGESVEHPYKYLQNNTVNAVRLLNAMVRHRVGRLIFSSTAGVYGEPLEIPITERHPLRPLNPYSQSKTIVEEILPSYALNFGLCYTSFRYFNAAGADPEGELGERHLPETHLIPLIFEAALGRRPEIKIYGDDYDTPDGTCIRDYVHVYDLAQAHILGLKKLLRDKAGDTFNLGTGKGYSVIQVIRLVHEVSGLEIPKLITGRRPGDASVLVSSCDKACRILGWKPRYPDLKDIIVSVWDWLHPRLDT